MPGDRSTVIVVAVLHIDQGPDVYGWLHGYLHISVGEIRWHLLRCSSRTSINSADDLMLLKVLLPMKATASFVLFSVVVFVVEVITLCGFLPEGHHLVLHLLHLLPHLVLSNLQLPHLHGLALEFVHTVATTRVVYGPEPRKEAIRVVHVSSRLCNSLWFRTHVIVALGKVSVIAVDDLQD